MKLDVFVSLMAISTNKVLLRGKIHVNLIFVFCFMRKAIGKDKAPYFTSIIHC